MSKVKLRIITILSFFMLIALVLGVAFGFSGIRKDASADSYAPDKIFDRGSEDKGEVKAFQVGAGDDAKTYTTFVMKNGGNVDFRRKLALKWYAGKDDAKYFDMQFEFSGLNFKKFTIAFESAEENVSKDAKATNYVVFEKDGEALKAYVKNAAEEESDKVEVSAAIDLRIDEADCSIGEFSVYVNDVKIGTFTNVGGYFLDYRSSTSTNPVTPMSFEMEAEDNAVQKVFMKELNGQSLLVTVDKNNGGSVSETPDGDGHYEVTGGKIADNAPAVLVINEDVYAFTLGQRYSLSYEAIDVCTSSVNVDRYYYMAKKKDGAYVKPDLKYGSSDYSTLTTSKFFMPTDDKGENEEEFVSIRFNLKDGRWSSLSDELKEECCVYLNWYAVDGALETLGEEENEFEYVKVIRGQTGPQYVTGDDFAVATEAYQDAVTAAAEGVSAGDGAYFYLPSLRELIKSDYADYRNLRFNIYYYKESQTAGSSATSATSLRYNGLRFEINESGTYRFRVMASDAAGNAMTYPLDGKDVTVTADNIWDIEEIPEFTFEATYKGATIEEKGTQTDGYRDTAYTVSSFKVIALSGIEKDYKLYRLDTSALSSAPDYEDLVKNAYDYVNGEDSIYKDHLVEITKYDEESDKADNKYNWNPTALSFVPQEAGYYFVEIVVTDPNHWSDPVKGYQVIQVNNPYDYTPGQSQWLQNNMTSVILFSVSAVLFVIIIILFVSKPSDKKVEEIDLEKLKGKKKANKK